MAEDWSAFTAPAPASGAAPDAVVAAAPVESGGAAAAPAADPWAAFSGPAVAPAAPAAPAALGHYAAPLGGEYGDLNAQIGPSGQADLTARAPAARIWDAAAKAWMETPPILGPDAEAAVDRYKIAGVDVGKMLVNPALKLAPVLVPGPWNPLLNAGMGGVSQAAMEAFGEKGGRDALALLASAPMAHGEVMSPRPSVAAAPVEAVRPKFVSERLAPDVSELDPRHAIAALIDHDNAENPPISGAPGRGAANQRTPVPGSPESALNRAAARPVDTTGEPPVDPSAPVVAPQSRADYMAANRAGAAPAAVSDNASAPVGGPPVPQSVGAAAVDDNGLGQLTPAQEQAYRSTAEGGKLLERQPVGVPDHSDYVPGVVPNDVERLQTVDAARELKALKVTAPTVAQEIQNTADANQEVRQGYHQATIGSPVDVLTATEARDAQRAADYPAAFANKTTPDTEPVVQAVQDSLGGPRARQNSQLQQYVAPLLRRLVNDDGSPKITDAEELYGFREDLARMRSKASSVAEPNLQHVSGELGDIIKATDAAIEKAAPGYRAYMDNFAGASRHIDEMRVLQAEEPKLYDSHNRITYAKFQQMMKRIVDARAAKGINDYKSITPETMARLWNLRDDLRRTSKAGELGSAPGSDTTQTTFDIIKNAAKGGAGSVAATGVGAAAGMLIGMPTVGAAAGVMTKDLISNQLSARTLKAQTARGMEMLHPTTPLNALLPGEVEPEVRPAFVPTKAPARPAAAAPAPRGAVAGQSALDLAGERPAAVPPGGAPVNALAPVEAPAAAAAPVAPTNELLPPAPPARAPTLAPAAAAAASGERAPFSFPLTEDEHAQLAAGAPAPAPVAPPPARPGASGVVVPAGELGPVRKVVTPSGRSVDVRYRVVEAKDLIASHGPDGTVNPAYDQTLQPRDRSRMESVFQVQKIANRPNQSLLGESPSTSLGAPLGHSDMQVESGNARAAGIKEAYRLGNGNAIRKGIVEQGYDVGGFNQPALYGEIQTPMESAERAAFARDAGGSPIAGMSAPERAAADAKNIPNDAYSLLQGGDVAAAKNADFARAFAEVLPPGERAGFMTSDGEVSAEGATRMRNALTQHAYGSDSLVSAMAEHADPDLKAFGGALMDAAGDMAKLRASIARGEVDPASDLAPALVEASRIIQSARRQRISLPDAIKQRDAFAPRHAMVDAVLKEAFGPDFAGRMTRSKFANLLSDYAENAAQQSGLFGAKESAGEILANSGKRYGYGTKAGGGPSGVSGRVE